jgi:hypothetical protein
LKGSFENLEGQVQRLRRIEKRREKKKRLLMPNRRSISHTCRPEIEGQPR